MTISTRDTIYVWEKQTYRTKYIIEKVFILFQNILYNYQYTFACVITNPKISFSTLKMVSSKYGF